MMAGVQAAATMSGIWWARNFSMRSTSSMITFLRAPEVV